ncbi:hypothetical protein HN873_052270 [Arachis hypogaea]
MKFGMGTLDDMNHLKNKRIRSVADLLQDQFGLALVRLENMVRGTIYGAIRLKLIPTPQNLVTSTPNLLPNRLMLLERVYGEPSSLMEFITLTVLTKRNT